MAKTWVQKYIEWGSTRAEKPWTSDTPLQYERYLLALERATGKAAEELDAEDLRTYFARKVSVGTWNPRYHAVKGFYRFLSAQGFFELTPLTN